MFPRSFGYLAPKRLEEIFEALETYPESKVLAGGQSLTPILKMRLVDLTHVIDLRHLPWDYVREEPDGLHIGALVRHRTIEEDAKLGQLLPILHDAAHHIADLQVRSMGTIGGAMAEADPAGDWPTVMLALDAEVEVVSRAGSRRVRADELFVDPYTPNIEHQELIKEVFIPARALTGKGAYLKFERRAGSFAVASVAAQCQLDAAGKIGSIGIGLGGAGLTPIKAKDAEAALLGAAPTAEAVAEAARLAEAAAEPVDDLRGTAEYKKEMVRVLTERAVNTALARIQGKEVVAHVF